MTDDQRLDLIASIRQQNLRYYAQLAGLLDEPPAGWVPRPPGGRDATLLLVRAALQEQPDAARKLLAQIAEGDAKVVHLTRELAYGAA